MGKRIIQRARGKGGPPYKSPSHRFPGKISYSFTKAEIIDIIHDASRDAPLAKLKTDKGEKLIIASEGMKVGDIIEVGKSVIMPVSLVPKGAYIHSIETVPYSGPKLCNSPGTKAIVVSHDEKKTIIQLPSKQFKKLHPNCLVTVGIPAGAGRSDKKMVKAGQKYHAMRARNKLYPRTSANAMNPVDHPFGGKTGPGMSKSVSRNRPPGAKVGSIASRRTGRRKR
ncbi:MAG: 50S ribosomal protein L2 [Candidatus Aenigmarchaeota archaeon]|nr:50S ribosomal protein L2 [Candidatus Aenigmarchaeota archaeon]